MKSWLKKSLPNCLIRRRLKLSAENSILLTFDDGPRPKITVKVLSLLRQFQARAIFFIVGYRAEKNPELLKEIVSQGHLVGNHTYRHPNEGINRFQDYKSDIIKCQQVIEDMTGVKPFLFRPARGAISLTGLRAARSAGLMSLFWSVEGGEWGFNADQDAAAISAYLKSHAGSRDIVLLHDDHPIIPDVLRELLPELKHRGLDLTEGIHHLK
jgi:peptidoglycan/xylan/chitin deacetylase (PgdA/CDA1 family)